MRCLREKSLSFTLTRGLDSHVQNYSGEVFLTEAMLVTKKLNAFKTKGKDITSILVIRKNYST